MYITIKTIHIISSTILFGTGAGIAFFMFRSNFTKSIQEKYFAARTTVLADYIFTLPAVLIQPITGFWLIANSGYEWTSLWLLLTYIIYAIAGACWLPVVWIQIKLKNIIADCIKNNSELPKQYHQLYKIWFMLGWPAFVGLLIVFYLMVAKPL